MEVYPVKTKSNNDILTTWQKQLASKPNFSHRHCAPSFESRDRERVLNGGGTDKSTSLLVRSTVHSGQE